ncbi:peptidyl-prolyl cis-trans isomerase-like [Lycorma delicatula]|uniref:peptidyl-prolyl cis-trans isomerase-like n=1 Tax=Lycorma delicatula TaxID=130591 RepID=UPI003F514898
MFFIFLSLLTVFEALGIEHIVTHQVYFDIQIGEEPAGKLVIGLFGNDVPKTVKNFYTLASVGLDGGLSYKGSLFYKVYPGFLIHGGDITCNTGKGAPVSIYGSTFKAEDSEINHDDRGIISMTDLGNHTHGSRFFILGGAMNWLNGNDVVIGKILEGDDVIKKIESKGSINGTVSQPIVIADCGAIPVHKIFAINWQPQKPFDSKKERHEIRFC